ncbi:MAG: hypothetical protein HW416_1576 [Chloroflexi bacterium]|nr:hypothetical protein [Chloroflexota bacterium]
MGSGVAAGATTSRTRLHGLPALRSRLAAAVLAFAVGIALLPLGVLSQGISERELDRIQSRVVELRRLELTAPVGRTFMNREELRAYNRETFFRDVTPEELEATQTLLEVLGYIPLGMNLTQLLLDVLGEQVLGFYDPATKNIYIVSDAERMTPDDEVTLAHEMTHALQDQHYDLRANAEARRHNNDRALAYQAMVEGDAVLSQSLYTLRYVPEALEESVSSPSPALDSAPLVLRRELIFPYEDGTSFVLQAFQRGSWAAVDALWQRPPESTTQILHPEKYRAGQSPITVDLPDLGGALGSEWRELDDDTVGELDLTILIEQYVDRRTADQAGTGWAGDHYKLLRRDRDGAVVFALRSTWESETDAREFYSAYQRLADGRYGASNVQPGSLGGSLNASPLGRPDASWAVRSGAWNHVLVRDGVNVALAIYSDSVGDSIVDSLRPTNARSPVPAAR